MTIVFVGVGCLLVGGTALILFALWMEGFTRGGPGEPYRPRTRW